ncbi:serine protease [Yoonia sp. I 8.24]|uniref:S1 family peptidase n=1 Tax=Yoonia sp. I 8.24 TaxID=1537229 RepID=UPI001EDEE6E2|nr:serine protease [Yoonia sp. I 8.24]MCG3268381.1 trypsin-like peptidase domain-containing protein [Yoonia sp. I 8.24]
MTKSVNDGQTYSAKITETNLALADLKLSWVTAQYTAEDGLGPLQSMHEAGDSVVAIAKDGPDGMTIIGSGVLVAPGLILTATHVLEDFKGSGHSPVFMTFLPNGTRIWLPYDVCTISGPSAHDDKRKLTSDMSLLSCTLNSDALSDKPLMIAPMKVVLPLIGDRLWAFGFRHQHIEDGVPSVTPFVSSGLVSGAFPHGRGEWMPSPCIEVEMEALSGMSGGPVVNDEGELVGIVSSSLDNGGPSFITLIWEALRLEVNCPPPMFDRFHQINILRAHRLGQAKVAGKVEDKPWGDVVISFSDAEQDLYTRSTAIPSHVDEMPPAEQKFTTMQIEAFVERYDGDMEDAVEEGAERTLENLSLPEVLPFLATSDVPQDCLNLITDASVEVFEGIEDFEVISIKETQTQKLSIQCYFHLRSVVWIVSVPTAEYESHVSALAVHFMNPESSDGVTKMELIQRCSFKATITFDRQSEAFDDYGVEWSAVRRRKNRTSKR